MEKQSYHAVGKQAVRKDGFAKVTGKGLFAGDIRLPGMLYARVLRPPAHGAKLKNADVSAAASAKGARVIQDGDLIAVLHATPDGAGAALERIRAEFDVPPATVDDTNILEKLTALAGRRPGSRAEGGSRRREGACSDVIRVHVLYTVYCARSDRDPHRDRPGREG